MACKCTLPDGSLSYNCFGTCGESIINMKEKISIDPMSGFAELILSQLDKRIDYRMSELQVIFQREQIELYKKAFLQGIKEGINIGIELQNKD